jgi:hypothetical protein
VPQLAGDSQWVVRDIGREFDMEKRPTWLGNDKQHFKDCHKRWIERLNRNMDDPNYKEEWTHQQCFSCKYFVPLIGRFMDDYGACTNAGSPLDGRVMFEHDGCDQYIEDADYWSGLPGDRP